MQLVFGSMSDKKNNNIHKDEFWKKTTHVLNFGWTATTPTAQLSQPHKSLPT